MRLGPPYSIDEIEATPFEYDARPFEETRRGKMWQARIDYWSRVILIARTLTIVLGAFAVGSLIVLLVELSR